MVLNLIRDLDQFVQFVGRDRFRLTLGDELAESVLKLGRESVVDPQEQDRF